LTSFPKLVTFMCIKTQPILRFNSSQPWS